MKYHLIVSFCILFASCTDSENQRLVWVCSCEQQKEVSKWVKESINSANNHSDEEMEDVIYQLERTAVRLTCLQQVRTIHYSTGGISSVEKDSCESIFNY